MLFSVLILCILLTLGSCNDSTCQGKCKNSLDIPLVTTLNAPLIAQLDIWALTEQLKVLIKTEVKTAVSLAIQDTVQTIVENQLVIVEDSLQRRINSSILDAIDKLNEKPILFAFIRADQTVFKEADVLKFDDLKINKGGLYDATTGVFTAQNAGVYQVSFLLMGYAQSAVTFQLHKNAEVYYHGYAVVSNYGSQGTTLLMTLQPGDKVFIRHRGSGSQTVQGNRHSFFSARLL